MIIFACSRGECACVRGSTHRKAHSNQHSLERRTLALDFAPLLKPSSLSNLPHMWKPTPLFLLCSVIPFRREILRHCFCLCSLIHLPPWNPTPLFLSLLSYPPSSMKSYAPVFVLALLSPLLHEILRPLSGLSSCPSTQHFPLLASFKIL